MRLIQVKKKDALTSKIGDGNVLTSQKVERSAVKSQTHERQAQFIRTV